MITSENFSLGGENVRASPRPTKTATARPQPTVIPAKELSCDKDNCKLLYKLNYCKNHANGDKLEFLTCLRELGVEDEEQMSNIQIVMSCMDKEGNIDYDCMQKKGMSDEMVEYIRSCKGDTECILQGLLGLKNNCRDCLTNNSLSECCPIEKYDENFEIIVGLCIGGGVLLVLLIVAIVISVNNGGNKKRRVRRRGGNRRSAKRLS